MGYWWIDWSVCFIILKFLRCVHRIYILSRYNYVHNEEVRLIVNVSGAMTVVMFVVLPALMNIILSGAMSFQFTLASSLSSLLIEVYLVLMKELHHLISLLPMGLCHHVNC